MMLDGEMKSSISEEQLSSLIFSLHQQLESSENQIQHFRTEVAERDVSIAERDAKIAELTQKLDWFQRQIFGQKSERLMIVVADPRQLSLGEEFLAEIAKLPAATVSVGQYQRGKSKKQPLPGSPADSGLRFDENRVPVKTIELPTPELEGLNADQYEIIDTEVSYKLGQEPASYIVLRFERKVVKLKNEEENEPEVEIIRSEPAPAVLDKSFADVSFLAGLQIEKFVYHQPFYRQHQRLERAGILLSRGTLNSYAEQTAELLEPIYHAIMSAVFRSFVLTADETSLKAGRSSGKMNSGYLLSFYGDQDEVAFLYSDSRALYKVSEVLSGFIGVLLTDGLDVYEKFAVQAGAEVVHALCWTHCRRYFEKALKAEPELAQTALGLIGFLYQQESLIREQQLDGAPKLVHRLTYSQPGVDEFFTFVQQTAKQKALLPTNPLTKALSYAAVREAGLRVFLRFPEVPLDTNHLERQQRAIALGRNNWKFCSTEMGARHVAIVQTLLTNCTIHGVDHYDYLVDILQRVQTHPVREVHLLTPKLWKEHFAADPLRSPIHNAYSP